MGPFSEIFKVLKDGDGWMPGSVMKAFAAAADKDRARLGLGSGNEIPSPEGRWFFPTGGGAGGGSFPFECVITPAPDTGYQRGIFVDSAVLTKLDPKNTANISLPTGRLTKRAPAPDDDGWETTTITDFGWVKVEFDPTNFPNIVTGGVSIESIGAGQTYGGGPIEYVNTATSGAPTYVQKYARFPIYSMAADVNNNPYVQYQWLRDNITLTDVFAFGYDGTGSNPQLIAAKWRTP